MSTDTSHEARARNAKAMALATVLHQHKASTALLSVLASHAHLSGPFWSMTAFLATEAHLMGTKPNGDPVTVHVPHSQATIDAVARILGDLIAHENDQAAIAEQVAPIPAEGETVNGRKATDSGEYRRTVRALDPETARAFAAFGQAAGR